MILDHLILDGREDLFMFQIRGSNFNTQYLTIQKYCPFSHVLLINRKIGLDDSERNSHGFISYINTIPSIPIDKAISILRALFQTIIM